MAKTIEVFKGNKGWVVRRENKSKSLCVKKTQKEAYLAAKKIAIDEDAILKIWNSSNTSYKKFKPKDDSGCFITTACVKYFGKEDNCYELTTLRYYRDSILAKEPGGEKLIQIYYEVAPILVSRIDLDENKKLIYTKILESIRRACSAIETKNFELAKNIYSRTVHDLRSKYNLS